MCDESALIDNLKLPYEVVNEVLENTNWFHLLEETSSTYRCNLGEVDEGMCCTDGYYWYEIDKPEEFLKELRKIIKQHYLESD